MHDESLHKLLQTYDSEDLFFLLENHVLRFIVRNKTKDVNKAILLTRKIF